VIGYYFNPVEELQGEGAKKSTLPGTPLAADWLLGGLESRLQPVCAG
jgi:hypothetical protein